MTKVSRGMLASLLSILCVCLVLGYIALSTGLVDNVLIERERQAKLRQVDLASTSTPPDIESLTKALEETDWFVAAVAAERIGQLKESGKLENEQADVAMQSLFEALASNGHWWRFGWDRDEPEFEQFRGAAIEAVSKYGHEALPRLLTATSSDNSFEREAACWVTLSILKSGSVDQATLSEQGITARIEELSQDDTDSKVQAACKSAQRLIDSSLQNP